MKNKILILATFLTLFLLVGCNNRNNGYVPEAISYEIEVHYLYKEGINVTGTGVYIEGSSVNLEIQVENENYYFSGWYDLDSNKLLEKSDKYQFDATRNYSVEARILPVDKEIVSLDIIYEKEMGRVSGQGDYEVGKYVELLAKPNPGYSFEGWFINNEIIYGSTYGLVVEENITIEAKFEKNEAVITIIYDVENLSVYHREYDKVLEVKDIKEGYIFKGWYDLEGNLLCEEEIFTYEFDKDTIVEARIEEDDRLFTVKFVYDKSHVRIYNDEGFINETKKYKMNERFFLYTKNADDYIVENIYINNLSDQKESVYMRITEDINVYIETIAKKRYDIFVDYDRNMGIVHGTGRYRKDEYVYLEAVAFKGYIFKGWYDSDGELLEKSSNYGIFVDKNIEVFAKFEKSEDFQVVLTSNVYGLELIGNGRYEVGSDVTVSFNEDENYEFLGWYDEDMNLLSTDKEYTFKILKDIKLFAKFEYKNK